MARRAVTEIGSPGPAPGQLGVARPRALPAGRVVVGGFLVAVAAILVFAASISGASSDHGQPWVVAARPLAAGTILGPGDLATSTMRLSGPAGNMAFRHASPLVGQTLAVALQPGELVQSSMLGPDRPPPRPVSVPVDPVSLANLSPGQPVDVLALAGSGSVSGVSGVSGASGVSVVVRGASLLAVGRASSGLLSSPSNSSQVTLGVSTLAEVEAVEAAAHGGTVALVAAEPADGVGSGPAASTP